MPRVMSRRPLLPTLPLCLGKRLHAPASRCDINAEALLANTPAASARRAQQRPSREPAS
jgi:hypothetical protein